MSGRSAGTYENYKNRDIGGLAQQVERWTENPGR